MNHAGVGVIDEGCNIFIPVDILSPLSIIDDVAVWGMFYPPEKEYKYELHKKAKYDFVLSPIPFDLWGKVGRIKVQLKNIPGAHKSIAAEICSVGGSILISEASRSAHSYDTWSIVISFDDLNHIDYDEGSKSYVQTKEKFYELEQKIKNNCKEFIYTDKNDLNLTDLVRITPYNALSYFYNVYKNKPLGAEKNNPLSWAYYKPFCLSGKNNGLLTADDCFKSIIEQINSLETEDQKSKVTLTFKLFCELETNDLNIRMALIPSNEEQKFFSTSVSFKKAGPNFSSRGFLNYVLSSLPDSYSVWRLVNRTMCFIQEREEGRTDLIIKDNKIRSNRDREDEIEFILNENVSTDLRQMLPLVVDCQTIGAYYSKIWESSIRFKDRYDVFISYSTNDEQYALQIRDLLQSNGFKCYMSGKNIISGDEFTEKILDALRNSREVLILYSNQAKKSNWVTREFGAAWALGKTIVPMTLSMEIEELPEWLQTWHACSFNNLEKYLSDLKNR